MTRRSLLLPLLVALFLPAAASSQVTRNLDLKAHFDSYAILNNWGYSACWSYIHPDGREYAVIGTNGGTAIYNVTNPAASYFVSFIPGRTSLWREMKQYRNWMYVVTEAPPGAGPAAGVQIIRMTDPENPVLVTTYAPPSFQTSHTVAVDTTRGILICNGTRQWVGSSGYASGMRFLSLANPEAPVEIGWWPGGAIPVAQSNYIHDSVPIGNRLYGSSIYVGIERVFDFTTPSAPVLTNSWTYPGAFSHNSWPDATGSILYVTDETNGEPLKIFDISNVMAPVLANAITSNPQAIVHNAHVLGNELYLSNYTEGIRILDIADPAHPAEFAFADSYAGPSGGYNGVWEVCPYFPSGTVIASDMNSGLYVYRPVRNYGIVRAKVVDQATGDPLSGVTIYLSGTDSLTTTADGIAQFAPNPGAYSVSARKFGYQTSVVNGAISFGGQRDTVVIEIPTVDLNGTVTDAVTHLPLDDSEVHLEGATGAHANGAGAFTISDVPYDTYEIEAHAPGHISSLIEAPVDTDPTVDFQLVPAHTWDNLETNTGWTIGAIGDNATSGLWQRVEPFGTGSSTTEIGLRTGDLQDDTGAKRGSVSLDGARPGLRPDHDELPEAIHQWGAVQPEYDRTPSPGTLCFVTGQGTDPANTGEADVDNGKTSLSTPALDMTGMAEPTIGYWRWFYGNTPPDDWLAVFISNDNGQNFVPVDTTRGIRNDWVERSIRVADYVTPTSQVRLKFVAADLGAQTLVEAAIDDIITYDAATPQVGIPGAPAPARFAFRTPWPNPSRAAVSLALELPRAGRVEVEVLDLAGRHVRTLHRGPATAGVLPLRWNGADDAGRPASAGLYFVRARTGDQVTETRLARMR